MSGVDVNPENELAIEDYASLADKTGYVDAQSRMEIAARTASMLRKIESRARRSAGETEDVDEQSPAKIHHSAPLIGPISQTDKQHTFGELVKSMDACELGGVHREIVEKLLVQDPKRDALVPSRFCSFHLAGFDLDEKSTAPLGPLYQPDLSFPREWLTEHVTTSERFHMADSAINVISLRVVRAGPDHTYPVEVYGKVIARDEVDHKCVYLFDCERKDAQLIKSEKDMLALTGPYRALVTLGFMYFEFDLKIKGKGGCDDLVQLSKGVMPYCYNPFDKRIIFQLPSFQSTVKLVLQRVSLPVAASLEVNVVNEGHDATIVHYDGKITAGTTRNYRQHMVLYDGSVTSGCLVRNGSLVLNRNLVAVKGYVEDPALKEDEKLALYVCFLDAGYEIEDEDKQRPEQEDEDEDEDEDEEEEEEEEEVEKDKDEEVDPKNVVTLKYPQRETVWEYGGHKLKVKVDWTAVRDTPKRTDFFHRYTLLPDGYKSPDYRHGGFCE